MPLPLPRGYAVPVLRPLKQLTCESGELVWTAARDGGTGSQEPATTGRLRREEIVFVLPTGSRSGGGGQPRNG